MNPTIPSNENIQELENLRIEIAQFKKRLDAQTTLTEQFIIKSVKHKMSRFHRKVYQICILNIVAILLWIWIKYMNHFSWGFTLFTILICLLSMSLGLYINRMDIGKMGENLRDTVHRLQKMKAQRLFVEKIGCFCVIPLWLAWFIFEYYKLFYVQDPYIFLGMIMMPLLGGIIGLIVGLRIFFKMQGEINDMIADIEQLQSQTD
ncbi:MAG: hypothetical protein IJ816_04140 [Alloprevotella sp.]|nr:hypothetical protein [Alloprevotella sp.]